MQTCIGMQVSRGSTTWFHIGLEPWNQRNIIQVEKCKVDTLAFILDDSSTITNIRDKEAGAEVRGRREKTKTRFQKLK